MARSRSGGVWRSPVGGRPRCRQAQRAPVRFATSPTAAPLSDPRPTAIGLYGARHHLLQTWLTCREPRTRASRETHIGRRAQGAHATSTPLRHAPLLTRTQWFWIRLAPKWLCAVRPTSAEGSTPRRSAQWASSLLERPQVRRRPSVEEVCPRASSRAQARTECP